MEELAVLLSDGKVFYRVYGSEICINREDYELAKRKFHAKYVDYVPGVGIDHSQFRLPGDKERQMKREAWGCGRIRWCF